MSLEGARGLSRRLGTLQGHCGRLEGTTVQAGGHYSALLEIGGSTRGWKLCSMLGGTAECWGHCGRLRSTVGAKGSQEVSGNCGRLR